MDGQALPKQNQPVPALHPVDSSHISSAAHDPASKALYVNFKDGSLYAYQGVSPGTYEALMSAKSPGAYFNERVKGQFRSLKIRSAHPKPQPQS